LPDATVDAAAVLSYAWPDDGQRQPRGAGEPQLPRARLGRGRLYVAPGAHLSTTKLEPHAVLIADGRPHAAEFSLDRNGFMLVSHSSAVSDFRDAAEVDRVYVAQAIAEVQRLTGADLVVSTGWVIRSAAEDTQGAQPPASDVHVDVHPDRADASFGRIRARHGLQDETFRRAIYTSLWRPISPPPQDWPLALCDYSSVDDAEGRPNLMINVDELPGTVPEFVQNERELPAASVFVFSPAHRWWYFPGMDSSEALLFKLHDTDHSVAWRAPHTAFRDPGVNVSWPRESIEIRTAAFFR
jgi:hypothetical protein